MPIEKIQLAPTVIIPYAHMNPNHKPVSVTTNVSLCSCVINNILLNKSKSFIREDDKYAKKLRALDFSKALYYSSIASIYTKS